MNNEPVPGSNYIYTGSIRGYKGRVGVASNIQKFGRGWMLDLANHKEWIKDGLEPVLRQVLASEIEPAPVNIQSVRSMGNALVPTPPQNKLLTTARDVAAFDGAEEALLKDCTKWLSENGYRHAVVGQLKAKGSGTTVGYPDLSFRHPSWPRGVWALVELKNAEGSLSPEQEDIWNAGGSFLVRCVPELESVASVTHALAQTMLAAQSAAELIKKMGVSTI